jgi:hypothetical protein
LTDLQEAPMQKYRRAVILALFVLPLLVPATAQAQQVWIVDILTNPARNWNRTVTLVGQVQNVVANPPGTTRGTYTLLDDSCPTTLTVRTKDLPPVGKTFSVTGVVIQDPTSTAPILNELSRAEPGLSSSMLFLLIGAGLLFLALLVVFIVLLMKPKKAAAPLPETVRARTQDTVRPAARPVPPAAPAPPPVAAAPMPAAQAPDRTTKVPPAPVAPFADATQRFVSLGADLVVERGPDKGREFPLHKPVTTIGRPGARKNDVELGDDTVSKDQASIYYDHARRQFSIANESATNPTAVNGAQITGPTMLENGSLIELGRTILRFKKN